MAHNIGIKWGLVSGLVGLVFAACGGGSGTNDAENTGGQGGASDSTGGVASTGGAKGTGGASSSTGGKTNTGGASSCGACKYGTSCVAGACKPDCPAGEVFCNGACIDPKTDAQFCGATLGCDNGEGPNGLGGMGGAPNPKAGETCVAGQECIDASCVFTAMVPGSNAVIQREGFSVQCMAWAGSVCVEPYIQIPKSAVTVFDTTTAVDVSECIADFTSLRPLWYYDSAEDQAATFCWIATGSTDYVSAGYGDTSATELCGWMYGSPTASVGSPTCEGSTARNYTEVAVPNVAVNLTWSFDGMDYCRTGEFVTYECVWPSAP